VHTIRPDTIEAVRCIDASMSRVDGSARIAENARNTLKEFERVSDYSGELTRRIADSAGHEWREAIKGDHELLNRTVNRLHRTGRIAQPPLIIRTSRSIPYGPPKAVTQCANPAPEADCNQRSRTILGRSDIPSRYRFSVFNAGG